MKKALQGYKIPEHIRSIGYFSGGYPFSCLEKRLFRRCRHRIPEHTRSIFECKGLGTKVFRRISVHLWMKICNMGEVLKTPPIQMAGTTISMKSFKQALILHLQGESNRSIAKKTGIDKETVNNKFKFIRENNLNIRELLKLEDPELEKVFHGGHSALTDKRHEAFLSKLDYFREQLKDKHVTRYLLWEEYIKANPDGYGKSQFYHHLSQNLKVAKTTTVLKDLYKPGELLLIDFAGDVMNIVDPWTGEVTEVQVFVGCLPFSDYTFAYAVPSQRVEDFIFALARCLDFLGGVPYRIKLDNLKAGVTRYHAHEPDFNQALQDMGNHCHFFSEACRPHRPRDKALVESAVRRVYNRVYAKLRHRVFHSIEELNKALEEKTLEHNQTRMQQHPYSRQECFVANEKDELQPLPQTDFEVIYTAQVKVQQNCHVLLSRDNCYYSVHHSYVGQKAILKYTRSMVKIFVNSELVSTHKRNTDRHVMYVTDNTHLASNSQFIRQQNVEAYRKRAAYICGALDNYIRAVFDDGLAQGFPVECRYNTCSGIISAARSYSVAVIEQACNIAIQRNSFSSRKFEHILKSVQVLNHLNATDVVENPEPTNGENLRGRLNFA